MNALDRAEEAVLLARGLVADDHGGHLVPRQVLGLVQHRAVLEPQQVAAGLDKPATQ